MAVRRWRATYLAGRAEGLTVGAAARRAGVHPSTVWRHKARNPQFDAPAPPAPAVAALRQEVAVLSAALDRLRPLVEALR